MFLMLDLCPEHISTSVIINSTGEYCTLFDAKYTRIHKNTQERRRLPALRVKNRDGWIYPGNGQVRHELLKGPGLLCLLLVVQRDLVAELPGGRATCARGAGHRVRAAVLPPLHKLQLLGLKRNRTRGAGGLPPRASE